MAKLPQSADRAAVLRAKVFDKKGDHDKAIAEYDRLIQGLPEGSLRQREARLAKAESLVGLKKFAEAEADVRAVIKAAPPEDYQAQSAAYNTLGDCLRAAGKPKDALLAYLHTDLLYARDKEQHPRALAQHLQALRELKRDDRADETWARLKQEYPAEPLARDRPNHRPPLSAGSARSAWLRLHAPAPGGPAQSAASGPRPTGRTPATTPAISKGRTGTAIPADQPAARHPTQADERQQADHLDAGDHNGGGEDRRPVSSPLHRGSSSKCPRGARLRYGGARSPVRALRASNRIGLAIVLEGLGRRRPTRACGRACRRCCPGGRCWSSGGRSRCRRSAARASEALEEVVMCAGWPSSPLAFSAFQLDLPDWSVAVDELDPVGHGRSCRG